jgi:hypothetical protein
MRFVWVLALVCLVAATAVRPLHVERRDPHVAALDVAPASLVVVARRQTPHLPELRLALFVVAPAPTLIAPPRVPASCVDHSPTLVDACAADTACARGPPIA